MAERKQMAGNAGLNKMTELLIERWRDESGDNMSIEALIDQTFAELDTDNSGNINMDELIIGLKQFGLNPTENEFKDIVNFIDTDDSGDITLDEFKSVVLQSIDISFSGTCEDKEFRLALSHFTKDKYCEQVDLVELEKCLKISVNACPELFKDIENAEADISEMISDFKKYKVWDGGEADDDDVQNIDTLMKILDF